MGYYERQLRGKTIHSPKNCLPGSGWEALTMAETKSKSALGGIASQLPIGYWMHRGCVPFFSPKQFASHNWATLRPIIEEFWKHGHQTLFYAEGQWAAHLDAFRELPPRSIVFHCDRDDVFEVKRKIGDRFAISGGVPNTLLSFGQPGEVRDLPPDECTSEAAIAAGATAIDDHDRLSERLLSDG